jgi:hypothetical protein
MEGNKMDNPNKELIVVAHNLPENRVQSLLDSYAEPYKKAKEVIKEAKGIVVTSADQIEEMKKARKVRLQLRDIRVHAENTRKTLKEDSLREGKAIDGMYNIIEALIKPVEKYLEDQEKFAEIQRQKELEKEHERRVELLTPYVPDITVYSLSPQVMSNETFNNLLESSKKAFQAQKEAEKRAEEERIAAEKAKEKENERIRKENEKLRVKLEKEREKKEAEARKAEEAERKLRQEKEAQEAKKRAEEEEKRKLAAAPDKEKLRKIYKDISQVKDGIKLTDFTSPEGIQIAELAIADLNRVLDNLVENIKAKNL